MTNATKRPLVHPKSTFYFLGEAHFTTKDIVCCRFRFLEFLGFSGTLGWNLKPQLQGDGTFSFPECQQVGVNSRTSFPRDLKFFGSFFFGNARTSQKRMRRRTAEIIWSLWKMKIWQELSLTFLGWLQRLLLVVGGSYWLVVIGVVSLAMTWSRVIPKSAMFQCLRGWEVLQGLSTGGEKGGAGISCYGVWANRMGNQWQGSRAKKTVVIREVSNWKHNVPRECRAQPSHFSMASSFYRL